MAKGDALRRTLSRIKEEKEVEPAHGYAFVESVTKIVLRTKDVIQGGQNYGPVYGTIRVWREEKDEGPYDIMANDDLVSKAKEFHPTYLREIAVALAAMPRVTAVEYTNASGDGAVIYVTW